MLDLVSNLVSNLVAHLVYNLVSNLVATLRFLRSVREVRKISNDSPKESPKESLKESPNESRKKSPLPLRGKGDTTHGQTRTMQRRLCDMAICVRERALVPMRARKKKRKLIHKLGSFLPYR